MARRLTLATLPFTHLTTHTHLCVCTRSLEGTKERGGMRGGGWVEWLLCFQVWSRRVSELFASFTPSVFHEEVVKRHYETMWEFFLSRVPHRGDPRVRPWLTGGYAYVWK